MAHSTLDQDLVYTRVLTWFTLLSLLLIQRITLCKSSPLSTLKQKPSPLRDLISYALNTNARSYHVSWHSPNLCVICDHFLRKKNSINWHFEDEPVCCSQTMIRVKKIFLFDFSPGWHGKTDSLHDGTPKVFSLLGSGWLTNRKESAQTCVICWAFSVQ